MCSVFSVFYISHLVNIINNVRIIIIIIIIIIFSIIIYYYYLLLRY